MPTDVIAHTVQSLVFTGFGTLPHGAMLRVRGIDRDWLQRLLPRLSFGRDAHAQGVQLLLSARGMTALGLATEQIDALGRQVRDGMTSSPSRQRIGDVGPMAPTDAWWTDLDHDAMLLVYGATAAEVAPLVDALSLGVEVSGRRAMRIPPGSREPFGFLDGITRTRVAREGAVHEDGITDGEVLFGHRDATGAIADGGAFGLHGSLVVVRELAQDVEAFWRFWMHAADDDAETALLLASRSVGRWPNGMPVRPGDTREPALVEEQLHRTSFADDPEGIGCPYGAHVRRANPRDTLVPDAALSSGISGLHSLIRRGRMFGPDAPNEWYPPPLRAAMRADAGPHAGAEPAAGAGTTPATDIHAGATPGIGEERGLMFIGLCTDLRRQFEFIMQNWLLAPKHAGLYNEVDPLLAHVGTARDFSLPTGGFCRHLSPVGGWVAPRGGGYYLMPARDALQGLLRSPPAPRQPPLG
ncbi:MAG: hypothetical protein M3Q42_13490 [Pseudomonadota bacterium]|nr:hypothetical protein [Pseudomonadota bacterium]